jgi:hypothetical protein
MSNKYLEQLNRKITGLKKNYKMMCESLAKDFKNEVENDHYYASMCSSSYIRDLPVLANEIKLLECLAKEIERGELKPIF